MARQDVALAARDVGLGRLGSCVDHGQRNRQRLRLDRVEFGELLLEFVVLLLLFFFELDLRVLKIDLPIHQVHQLPVQGRPRFGWRLRDDTNIGRELFDGTDPFRLAIRFHQLVEFGSDG